MNTKRLIAEGVVIVGSVLLALSAEAWLESRRELDATRQHLEALVQDFGDLEAAFDTALAISADAVAAGETLFQALSGDSPEVLADSALRVVRRLMPLGLVREPNRAAYDALASTGRLELVEDRELVRELGNFYGAVEGLRVSEQRLISLYLQLIESPDFANYIGSDRIVSAMRGTTTAGVSAETVLGWARSRRLRSDLAAFWIEKTFHLEEQTHMRDEIVSIRRRLKLQIH